MTLHRAIVLLSLAAAWPASAMAQPLGTFRWQLQPHCNVVTVNVIQQGTIYTLDGTDDRCGGGNQPGSVTGIAYLTPLGQVGFGLTSVLPGGTPMHTEATISLAGLNGTWRDSLGQSGTFTFTPGAGTGGLPRPVIAPKPISRFAGGDDQHIVLLPMEDTVIRSVTIDAPANGRVVVHASGFFDFADTGAIENVRCEVTTQSAIDNSNTLYARENAVSALHYVPFAITRGFVVEPSSTTFRLVCVRLSGSVGLWRSFMTATYTPQ